MDRRFMSNMMASFHRAKPVDPHSVVVVKKPAKTSSKVDTTPSTSQQMEVGTKAKDGQVIKKKKKKKLPNGTLSVEAVIAKRKRKEERKRLKEAAAAQGQRPETSQGSVVGQTTSAPEIVVLPDVSPVQRLPESQTPSHLAPNTPAVRKKTKKSKKDKRPALEPSRAVEVPVAQAVGPEIIEILDTDDGRRRCPTYYACLTPLLRTNHPGLVLGAVAAVRSASGKKKKRVSSSKEKTSSTPQASSKDMTAIASSSSREKTPIPPTSSPNTTIEIAPPSSTTQKKKVSGSKEKSQKAEKAARKQARAERRARKAERRAKRAGKDKNNAAAVAGGSIVPIQSGEAGTVSSARESGKKDKQKKSLRTAWAPGGRKEVPIVIEERERSVSPLMQINNDDKREWEAEERFKSLMRNLGNSAVPSSSTPGHVEEPWQTELRCTSSKTNIFLRSKGIILRRGYFTKTEKSAAIHALEQYERKAHKLTHFEVEHAFLKPGKSDLRHKIGEYVARRIPKRSLSLIKQCISALLYPHKGRKTWSEKDDDELYALHELYPSQWKKIASLMDRSRDECQLRYLDRIIPQRHGTTEPWTPAEDAELTQLVEREVATRGEVLSNKTPRGFPWPAISSQLTRRRTARQCYRRWNEHILRKNYWQRRPEMRLAMLKLIRLWRVPITAETPWADIDAENTITGQYVQLRDALNTWLHRAPLDYPDKMDSYFAMLQAKTEREIYNMKQKDVQVTS